MATPWLGIEYIVGTPAQFWNELEEALQVPPTPSLEQIDLALRTFVYFCARYYHDYLHDGQDLDRAVNMLFNARFFDVHTDRMTNLMMDLIETRQSQDPVDSVTKLHILLHTLIQYGMRRPHIFKLLREPRMSAFRHKSKPFIHLLIEILNRTEEEAHATGKDSSIEGMIGYEATELLYEVLRVKRLTKEELPAFNIGFITHLFEIVEQTRDGDERYNYALIRLIIALNEQFMVAELDAQAHPSSSHASPSRHHHSKAHFDPKHPHHHHHHHPASPTRGKAENLVLKVLKTNPGENRTFGENLIFILNRLNSSSEGASSEDLCVSLLILKILYLLFSTSSTSEYFYTNDLRVLVDVFIRELLDLPEESEGLRHTYLRVLHPLMTNTQLRMYPYKRAQIRATLLSLLSDDHIRPVSPTTKRLVERNLKADWCRELSPAPENNTEVEAEAQLAKHMSTIALKEPAVQHLRHEDSNPMNSTLSVNAVAAADLPFKRSSPRVKSPTHSVTSGHVISPTHKEYHVGHSHSRENPRIHGHGHEAVQMPHHERKTSSHSRDSKSQSFVKEGEGLPLKKKHRTPPPRPPKKFATTQSLPATPSPEPNIPLLPDSVTRAVSNEPLEMQPVVDAHLHEEAADHSEKTRCRRAPPPTPHRKRKTSYHSHAL